MTADERIECLELHGFAVSRRAFPGIDGTPLNYALELQLDGTRGNHNNSAMQGRQYSIDLESGVWNRWGTDDRREFNVGPWNELAADIETDPVACETNVDDAETKPAQMVQQETGTRAAQPAATDDPWLSHEFIVRCLEAGFVIDYETENRVGRDDLFGNRWAIFKGERYLLFPATCNVVDRKLGKRELSEFVNGQKTSCQAAEVLAKSPVFLKTPQLEYTGNTKQVGLF